MDMEEALARACHDLKEPLRTVTSFTQLLSREMTGRLSPEADQYMAFILEGTARMRALVDGLQTLSRAGGPGSAMTVVNCGDIVAECVRGLPACYVRCAGKLPEVSRAMRLN